jgi:TP901 family phage tail tape measure protein
MAQFAVLLPTFATLNRAIQGSVKFLFDFDSALRDIVRIDISGLSNRMDEVARSALDTASAFGVSAIEVLETTRVFKQAGFSIEESQKKAQTAILATQVSTLTSAQAVEVFIAASKQFGAQGENSIAVLDKLAKVEDEAAVNASDVAEAFRAGGNALATFAKDIDDSVGVIAALREQTRKSGREIGTFLKTIQTRIFAAGEARDAVEALGVEVENLDGSLRPTLAVLNDLKTAFDGLTEAQQANAAKSIAGIRQFESLAATLASLDRANELSIESANAAGTAEAKRAITDEKLIRTLGRLKAAGEDAAASIGEAGIADALKDALKFATSLLNGFKGLADIIDKLGTSLAPLLALVGTRVVRAVTGLAAGAAGGVAGGGAGAQSRGVAELNTASQVAAGSLNKLDTNVNKTSSIFRRGGSDIRRFSSTLVQEMRNEQAARQQAAQAARNEAAVRNQGIRRFAAFNVAAIAAPIAINALTQEFVKAGKLSQEAASVVDSTISRSVGLGIAFGSISKKAGIMAGSLSLAAAAAGALTDFLVKKIEEAGTKGTRIDVATTDRLANDKALATEFAKALASDRNRTAGGGIDTASAAADVAATKVGQAFLDRMEKEFDIGAEEATRALGQAFAGISKGSQNARNNILKVSEELGLIESPESLRVLNEILDSDIPATYADKTNLTLEALGKAGDTTSRFADELVVMEDHAKRGVKAFAKLNDVLLGLVGLQDLNRELEMLSVGVEFSSDKFARLRDEAQLLGEAAQIAEQNFGNVVANLVNAADRPESEDGFGVQTKIDKEGNVTDASTQAKKVLSLVLKEVETSGLKAFQRIRGELDTLVGQDEGLQNFTKALEDAVRDRFEAQIESQKAVNAVEQSIADTRKTLAKEQEKAVTDADEALSDLNKKILSFGTAVSAADFAALDSVVAGDIESILAGEASGVSEGVRQLIISAFGEGVQKAENQLGSTIEQTQRDFDMLTAKLGEIRTELGAFGNVQEGTEEATRKARLEIEEQATVRALENAELEGGIKITEARLALIKAQIKAEEEAAEAEAKRLAAVETLTQASFDFENALNSAAQAFDDFTSQRLSELFQEEASAQEELQAAQSDVLSSTGDLADAYANLQQAIFAFNGAIAEAQIESNLFAREIAILGGGISSFAGRLQSLEDSFDNVLRDANITLEQRISLERQLAEETLSFLENARSQIVNAGLQIFGQSGSQNQELQQGIAGLQMVAEQLGGSFENFLNLDPQAFSEVQNSLLALPQEFRQQILNALSFLPDTASIGGFSVDQLREALGQVGAGVAPDEGLPSIEELNNQQVEQLQKLQDLAAQDANLQIGQVIAAQRQVELAQEQLDAAQIAQERAEENLGAVRDAVQEEAAVLMAAQAQRDELTDRVIAAQDASALRQIEKEAQLFAEQNATFREVGSAIVQGLGQVISARLGQIGAGAALADLSGGFIPNAAGGLNIREAAGLLRAGMREKRAMPGGAGLAVANTSEAVIPMNKGFIPNFAQGSDIAASLDSLRGIDAGFVAAVSNAIQNTLGNLNGGGNEEQFDRIISVLEEVRSGIDSIDESNTSIQSSAATSASNASDGTGATTGAAASDVNINVTTNQRSTVQVAGIDNLRTALQEGLQGAAMDQVEEVITPLTEQIDAVLQVLAERGLISGVGQPG